jgi:hypothetical protein
MPNEILILDPVATGAIGARQTRRIPGGLRDKVIGFIDNGKPNFHFLVDDLAEILLAQYGVAAVFRHRKRGSVPVLESALQDLAGKCDAVITGSGD